MNTFSIKEHVYLYASLGVAIGFGSSSSINGSDETNGFELLPLSHLRSIEDGVLTFCHVVCEEEARSSLSDCESMSEMLPCVH